MDPSLDNKGYVVSHVTPRQALERKVESVFDDRYTFSMAGGESESERREGPHALLALVLVLVCSCCSCCLCCLCCSCSCSCSGSCPCFCSCGSCCWSFLPSAPFTPWLTILCPLCRL